MKIKRGVFIKEGKRIKTGSQFLYDRRGRPAYPDRAYRPQAGMAS
jgi:hypothetical protein